MIYKLRVWLKESIAVILLAVVFALLIRTFVLEARIIPSSSMLPTLQLQSRVLVNKLSYIVGDIERGDIVVFKPPESLKVEEDYIKRVIALPGETVEVKGSQVYVDGEALTEPYILEPPAYEFGPFSVPENCLFVMGDNRNNSFDSHAWGALEKDRVKGRAFVIYWPIREWSIL